MMATLTSNELEVLTDHMIFEWMKAYTSFSLAYSGGRNDGPLALTETKRTRSRPFNSKSEVASARVHAVETRTGKSGKSPSNPTAERMEVIMLKLKAVHYSAYRALVLYYCGCTYREIGSYLVCSHTYAQKYKDEGFSMVMMEIADNDGDFKN